MAAFRSQKESVLCTLSFYYASAKEAKGWGIEALGAVNSPVTTNSSLNFSQRIVLGSVVMIAAAGWGICFLILAISCASKKAGCSINQKLISLLRASKLRRRSDSV